MNARRHRYRIAIYSESYQPMIDLIYKYGIEVLDHGSRRLDAQLYRAYAIADEATITRLGEVGYRVERLEDVDETAKARRAEVGVGNRFRKQREP